MTQLFLWCDFSQCEVSYEYSDCVTAELVALVFHLYLSRWWYEKLHWNANSNRRDNWICVKCLDIWFQISILNFHCKTIVVFTFLKPFILKIGISHNLFEKLVIFILENLKQKWLVNYTSVAQFQWINSKFGNCTLFKIEDYSAIFLQDIYGMYLLIINYIVPEPKLSLISMLMASSAYIYQLDLKSFVSAWFYDVPAKNVVFSTFFFLLVQFYLMLIY